MKELNVVITMDCERPTSETVSGASGPPDYASAETWTRAYDHLAGVYGFPVTYFIHPETALEQAPLFAELENGGACLGLHVHPLRFGDGRYANELGGLSEVEARAVLSEATALWQHALGKRPLYFRPGAVSANDSTYRILAELGFRGGSVSLPGRVFPDVYAVWAGAAPDPHRAHALFRQLEGDLPFAEMPFSVDFSTLVEKNGRWQHWDLRPDFEGDHRKRVHRIVEQIKARDPAVPVINLATHNDSDYTNPGDPVCRNFRVVLDAIAEAGENQGMRPVGATLAAICDRVLDLPPRISETVTVGGRVFYQPGRMHEFDLS